MKKEQNLQNSTEQAQALNIPVVIGSVDSKIDLVGKKGKELWYPTYAPHIDMKTGKSILTEIYIKHPNLRHYR